MDKDLVVLAFHLAGGLGPGNKRKILEFYREPEILFSLEESDFRSDTWIRKATNVDTEKNQNHLFLENTQENANIESQNIEGPKIKAPSIIEEKLKGLEREEQKRISDSDDFKEFWTLKRKKWLQEEWVVKKKLLFQKAEKELEKVEKLKAKMTHLFSLDYPKALEQIEDSPIVLYYKGKLSSEDFSSVSVVGSRTSSWNGLRNGYDLAFDLADRGVTVVSGIAKGVDSKAHIGALEAGGRTIGVLGCGIDRIYPKENRELYEQIIHSGCILSEFPVGTPPIQRNFPIRNRVIAGLSVATVLVEASRDSGALYTAKYALGYGREVYAFPGPANSPNYSGTHWLIQNGAVLIENSEDLLRDLSLVLNLETKLETKVDRNIERKNERIMKKKASFTNSNTSSKETSILKKKSLKKGTLEKREQKKKKESPNVSLLDKESKKILDSLGVSQKSLDQVVEKTGFPIDRVLTLLMELEMKGYCIQESGQYFI